MQFDQLKRREFLGVLGGAASPELSAKRLELLSEIVPGLSPV